MTQLGFSVMVLAGGLIGLGASAQGQPLHLWKGLAHVLTMIGILGFILVVPAKRTSRFPRAFAWSSSWTRTRTVLAVTYVACVGYTVTWTWGLQAQARFEDPLLFRLALGLGITAFLALLVLREHWVEFSPDGVSYGGRLWRTQRVDSPPVRLDVGDSHAVITLADGRTRNVLRDPLMSRGRWRAQWVEMQQFLEKSRSVRIELDPIGDRDDADLPP